MRRKLSAGFSTLAASAVLLSACSAAQMEEFRAEMAAGPGSGTAVPTGGVTESVAKTQGVAIGQVVQGSIDRPGEQDDYRFSGAKGQEVVLQFLRMESPCSSYDMRMTAQLLNTTANAVLATQKGCPPERLEQSATQRVVLPETGDFIVRVHSPGDQDRGTYQFRLLPVNRMPETAATAVVAGQIVSETLEHQSDIDEFQYRGTAGEKIAVHLQGLGGGGPSFDEWLTLDVLAPDGTQVLGQARSHGQAVTIDEFHSEVISLPATGMYRFRVYGPTESAANQGPYRFVVRRP